jgi:hypothetical protein
VPRHAARDGVDREPHVDPTITTRPAIWSTWAAPSAVSLFTGRASPTATEVCSWPKAPNRTFVKERFMAIVIDRMRPEDPSSAPAV